MTAFQPQKKMEKKTCIRCVQMKDKNTYTEKSDSQTTVQCSQREMDEIWQTGCHALNSEAQQTQEKSQIQFYSVQYDFTCWMSRFKIFIVMLTIYTFINISNVSRMKLWFLKLYNILCNSLLLVTIHSTSKTLLIKVDTIKWQQNVFSFKADASAGSCWCKNASAVH